MTNLVSIITPVAGYHTDLLPRCVESVQAQTVRCTHIVIHDVKGRGAGAVRNQGIEKVDTPFVVFLDADDWLEKNFIEECLRAYDGAHYIYTDFVNEDGERFHAPDCAAWADGTWHVVTTLLPTVWVKHVGGFDEDLPYMEDSDLYSKLCAGGMCGKRLAKPLFYYGKGGQRSQQHKGTVTEASVRRILAARYGDKPIMGCCGDNPAPVLTFGAQAGDMLVRPKWYGTRRVRSTVTGRDYGRIDGYVTVSIDPRDFKPQDYDVVQAPPPAPPPMLTTPSAPKPKPSPLPDKEVLDMALALDLMDPPPYTPSQTFGIGSTPAMTQVVVQTPSKPNITRVLEMAGVKAPAPIETSTDPIFIMPEKKYPSYIDFWRLVQLSGFEVMKPIVVAGITDTNRPLIVVSPEILPLPDHLRNRVIVWSLEYTGDYAHDYDGRLGELWASDPQWAADHHAKYVLLGSHPDLCPSYDLPTDDTLAAQPYDVTLLGYMIPRRQHIKNQLAGLKWTLDYPGHGDDRHLALSNTRLMLHVHQHETPALAPPRLALAAAYRLPVLSEALGYETLYDPYVQYADYAALPDKVTKALRFKGLAARGRKLHDWLCVENPFRKCVEEALAR